MAAASVAAAEGEDALAEETAAPEMAAVDADVEPDAELEPVEPVDEVVLTVEPVAGEPFTDVEAAAVVLNASKVFAAVGLTAKTMPAWQCLREESAR